MKRILFTFLVLFPVFSFSQGKLGYTTSQVNTILTKSVLGDMPTVVINSTTTQGTRLGPELLTNNKFTSDLSGWTVGANWSFSGGGALHTAGSTAALSQNVTVAQDSVYLVSIYQTNNSTSNVTFRLSSFGTGIDTNPWSDAGFTFLYNQVAFYATSAGSVALTITPSSTYNGTIDSISVRKVIKDQVNSNIKIKNNNVESISIYSNPLFYNQGIGLNSMKNVIETDYGGLFQTGAKNVALGNSSGSGVVTGYSNVFIGFQTGAKCVSGYKNTFIGMNNGTSATSATWNTGIGFDALQLLTTGNNNTAIGVDALNGITSNYRNTAIGGFAAGKMTTGNDNVFIGLNAGFHASYGLSMSNSVYIGAGAAPAVNGLTNVIAIGYGALSTKSYQTVIGTTSTVETILKGGVVFPTSSATTIVASTGLTAAMIASTTLKITGATAPIDITANPQIVDGADGQILIIQGNDDVNTVTFDDGNGLQLNSNASCALGKGDKLVLQFDSTDDVWYELFRTNN